MFGLACLSDGPGGAPHSARGVGCSSEWIGIARRSARGAAPQPITFFACAKKVIKESTPRSAIPAGFPPLLGAAGGCATRPGEPHTPRLAAALEQCSPKTPALPALLGGG